MGMPNQDLCAGNKKSGLLHNFLVIQPIFDHETEFLWPRHTYYQLRCKERKLNNLHKESGMGVPPVLSGRAGRPSHNKLLRI